MNTHMRFIGAIVLAWFMVACATPTVERQERTARTASELTQEMIATRAQIDRALASLEILLSAPPESMRVAYDQYVADVNAIDRHANRVDDKSRVLNKQSEEWLSAWQQAREDVGSVELRQASERRQEEMAGRLDSVVASVEVARQTVMPFVERLEAVKTVVGSDLTPTGVETVSSIGAVQNTDLQGRAAAHAIEVAIADLQNLNRALSVAVQ